MTQALERTLTSNEVAEMIGTTNGELLKTIRTYIGYLAQGEIPSGDFFIESTYKDGNNQERPNYLLTKQGCEMVSNKLTGAKGVQFTAKYVSRFNEMESHIQESQSKLPQSPMEVLSLMFDVQKDTIERVDTIESEVYDMKENQLIGSGDYGYISRRIHQRVSEIARGYGKITQKQRGELYKDINGGVKRITGVGARTQLRAKHYQVVIDFINDWEPSTATKTVVRQMNLLDEE